MANKRITELTLLNAVPATGDVVPIVDVDDTTDSANGTTKKLTVANLVKLLVNGLTGVLRSDSGVVSVDTNVTDIVSDASETVAGKVEEATDAQTLAGTATGETGAKLFVTPAKLKGTGLNPVVRVYKYTSVGATDSRFDITNPAGTTFRYTWDGTGTDPGITAITFPVGAQVNVKSVAMTYANTGYFVVTGSGANYFEVTNAAGAAENDKTLSSGFLNVNATVSWSKPTGLRYVVAEVVGGGGGAGGLDTDGTANGATGGGGGGGYSKELIAVATLGATETVTVGAGGKFGDSSATPTAGGTGGTSSFGSLLTATGGLGSVVSNDDFTAGAAGGLGASGDVNIAGGAGGPGGAGISTGEGGPGGSSVLGGGGVGGSNANGGTGGVFGGGGGGASTTSGAAGYGGAGGDGIIIVTEYYI